MMQLFILTALQQGNICRYICEWQQATQWSRFETSTSQDTRRAIVRKTLDKNAGYSYI